MEHTKRQREILTASLELLAAGGMARLTIRNLAEKLGITEPAIYRHFRNKSEIIRTLIGEFDRGIPDQTGESSGFEAVARFIRSRIAQVAEQPPLAKVVFSEELFLEEPDFSRLLLAMMHRHREKLAESFREAQHAGEIRADIPEEMLFRLVFGPVRLLVKQWGLSGEAFDLRAKGEELIGTLRTLLAPAGNPHHPVSTQTI